MAIIPSGEKVFMVSNGTNTTFSGSAATKAMQEWYTMQDIIDSTKLSGTNYAFVAANGTEEENGTELEAAYNAAKLATPYDGPLTNTNRFTIIVAPGKYHSANSYMQFLIDTDFIDIISLSGDADVYLSGVDVSAADVYLKGLNTTGDLIGGTTTAFNLSAHGANQIFDTCVGGDYSFGFGGTSTGKFIDCIGGNNSFCSAITMAPPLGVSYISDVSNAAGTYINCIARDFSFGVDQFSSGKASGVFTNCISGSFSFGVTSALLNGNAIGEFTNCTSGDFSFGAMGLFSGVIKYCVAGTSSFGTTITGKIYYSKLTSGSYSTVSGTGQTRYCLDGTNTPNNQG